MEIFIIPVFLISILFSILAIRSTVSIMHTLNITDKPDDEHKLHDINTPFVGGVGMLVVLCFAIILLINLHPEHFQKYIALLMCSIIIWSTGFVDDMIKLGYKLRLAIQALVALIMILVGGVVVNELGGLLFGHPLQLGTMGIIFTLIATIGGINALNMMDGVDGLSGSIALVSLLLTGTATYIGQDQPNLILICVLAGGVVGFLNFNLRHPYQRHARVFLGDNGSMLLGVMFAWILVDIAQDPNPSITPVTAIWLFSVPLMDMFGVMLRRVRAGKSPFTPDRQHLHHLLMRSGFRVSEIVFTITLLHCLLGIIGLAGLYSGVSEFAMLLGFLLILAGYFYLTYRPLLFIAKLRNLDTLLNTRLGFAPVSNSKILIGNYSAKEAEALVRAISDELGSEMDFWIRIFRNHSGNGYAITFNIWVDKKNSISKETVRKYIAALQWRLIEQRGIHLHRFFSRDTDSYPEIHSEGNAFGESKVTSRRKLGPQALSFEVLR